MGCGVINCPLLKQPPSDETKELMAENDPNSGMMNGYWKIGLCAVLFLVGIFLGARVTLWYEEAKYAGELQEAIKSVQAQQAKN